MNIKIPLLTAILFTLLVLIIALNEFMLFLLSQGSISNESYVVRWFNISGEMSFQSWFSSVLLAGSGLIALVCASISYEKGDRMYIHWITLSLGFIFMSADESISIHEHFADMLLPGATFDGPFRFSWVVVALPFVAVMALAYFPFLSRLPRVSANRFMVAGIIYVGGALGFEIIGAAVFSAGNIYIYGRISAMEEILEISGIILLVRALMLHVFDAGFRATILLSVDSQTKRNTGYIRDRQVKDVTVPPT